MDSSSAAPQPREPAWAAQGAMSIWDADRRPRDGIRVAAALVAPFSLAGFLLWLVVPKDARHYLGLYLSVGAGISTVLWALFPALQKPVARSRALVEQLLSVKPTTDSTWASSDDGISGLLPIWLEGAYDVELMGRHGISVFALWPLTRPFLPKDERDLSANHAAHMRAALAASASSTVSMLATGVTSLAAWSSHAAPRLPILFVLIGLEAIGFGSLMRSRTAARQLYSNKVASVLRHAPEITQTYGKPAEDQASALAQLNVLSRRVLEGQLVAGQAAARGELPVDDAVRAAVRDSLEEVLAPKPPIAMEGAIRAGLRQVSPAQWNLDLEIRVDPAAWTDAVEKGDTPGMAAFRTAGGRREATVPIEIMIDAPGRAVETPTGPLSAVVPTTGGQRSWTVTLTGQAREDTVVWVSLYSVGRFVQAVPAAAAT